MNLQKEVSANEHAFMIQLYHDFSRLMYFTAQKYMDNCLQEQEDIVQESFLNLLEKEELLKTLDKARLASYIVATVRNAAINAALRQNRKRMSTAYISDLSDDILQDNISVIDAVIAQERREELLRAMDRLNLDERLLLDGRYYLEYDYQHLSEIFHTTQANIRMRLTRVRRKLLRLLKEMEVEEHGATPKAD